MMKSVTRTTPIAMNMNQSNTEATMKQATAYQQGVWTFDSSSVSDSSSIDSDESPTTPLTASPLVGIPSHHASMAAQLLQQRRSNGGMMAGLAHNRLNANGAAIALLNQRLQSQGVEATNEMLLALQAQRRSQLELAALAASSSSMTSNSMSVPNMHMMKRRLSSNAESSGTESGPHPNKKFNGASLALAALNQQQQHHHHQRQQVMMAMAAQQRQQQQFHAVVSAASDHAASSGKPTILRGVPLSHFRQLNSSLQRTNSIVSYPRVESDSAFEAASSRSNQLMKNNFKRSASAYVIKGERGVTQPEMSDLANKKVEVPKPKPVKPEEYLRTLLKKKDLDLNSFSVNEGTFLPNTKKQTEDYPEAAQAARDENLEALTTLHQEGKNLQSANVYGESIIHIVCRRGNFPCYEFLTQKAKVSIRVRDDIGRTPLHDAAWTDKPNFDLVETILRQEPDLLFARDNRKSSPLAYVPPNRWTRWCKFLDENPELIQLAIDSQKEKAVVA